MGDEVAPADGAHTEEVVWRRLAQEHPELSRSLAIGLGVLECFDGEHGSLDLEQLTAQLDIASSSTLHRYTSALVADGYLEQTTTARSYRLAARAGDIGLAAVRSQPVHRRAQGGLRELRERLQYTTSLVALDGTDVVYLDCRAGWRRGQYEADQGMDMGTRLPALRTAAGKVLIANLPPAQRNRLVEMLTTDSLDANGLSGRSALHRELEGVLRTGAALSDEEHREGLRSIAAPVANERGTVVAALELSAPAATVAYEALTEASAHLLRTAAAMIVVPAESFPEAR